jgi:hypothetical protein
MNLGIDITKTCTQWSLPHKDSNHCWGACGVREENKYGHIAHRCPHGWFDHPFFPKWGIPSLCINRCIWHFIKLIVGSTLLQFKDWKWWIHHLIILNTNYHQIPCSRSIWSSCSMWLTSISWFSILGSRSSKLRHDTLCHNAYMHAGEILEEAAMTCCNGCHAQSENHLKLRKACSGDCVDSTWYEVSYVDFDTFATSVPTSCISSKNYKDTWRR